MPNTVAPSLNVTVPVAGPPVTATVAVKVTFAPYAPLLPSDEARVVVDGCGGAGVALTWLVLAPSPAMLVDDTT